MFSWFSPQCRAVIHWPEHDIYQWRCDGYRGHPGPGHYRYDISGEWFTWRDTHLRATHNGRGERLD